MMFRLLGACLVLCLLVATVWGRSASDVGVGGKRSEDSDSSAASVSGKRSEDSDSSDIGIGVKRNIDADAEVPVVVRQLTQVSKRKRGLLEQFEFPETMEFTIKIGQTELPMILKKHSTMRTDITLTDDFGQLEHDLSRNVCIYQDEANMASMVVECDDHTSECSLLGSVAVGGQRWKISPDEENPQFHKARRESFDDKNSLGLNIESLRKRAVKDAQRQTRDVPSYDKYSNSSGIPDCYIVEALPLVDETVWEFFLEWAGGDEYAAETKLMKYFLDLYTEIDLRYCLFDTSYAGCKCIRIYLAGVHITKKREHSWSVGAEFDLDGKTVIDGVKALRKCGKLQKKRRYNSDTSQFDLAQCWTFKNVVWEEYANGTYYSFHDVLAYINVACDMYLENYAVSLIEGIGDGADKRGAKAIGHNLGARSDGKAGCDDDDRYIMSYRSSYPYTDPSKFQNSWKFSSCSHRDICNYIGYLSDNCLLDHGFTKKEFWNKHNRPLPGKTWSMKQQCELRHGHGSEPCDMGYDQYICSLGIGCTTYEGCKRTRVLSGTSCGNNKICFKGMCVGDTYDVGKEYGYYSGSDDKYSGSSSSDKYSGSSSSDKYSGSSSSDTYSGSSSDDKYSGSSSDDKYSGSDDKYGKSRCEACGKDKYCEAKHPNLRCRPAPSNSYYDKVCQCVEPYYVNSCGECVPDENECEDNNGTCDYTCVNTIGSYYCECPEGYVLQPDGHSCEDENECADNDGGCEQMCTNTEGSFYCSCLSGYILNDNGLCCDDIDECLDDNAGCRHFCNNIPGSYECQCFRGYELKPNKHGCRDKY